MTNKLRIMGLVATAGLAGPALAQDSVSSLGTALPGDGLSPWAVASQVNNYVVDLTAFNSSWGTEFGIAPIAKASSSSSAFSTGLISAQAMSQGMLHGVCDPTTQYTLWTAAGGGIHPANNDQSLNSSVRLINSRPSQFGFGFAEFDTSDSGAGVNNIVGGVGRIKPSDPSRLYITRVMAAVNSVDGTGNKSQFGFGGADAGGNVSARTDNFGADGDALPGNNLFRFDSMARNATLVNAITAAAAGDPGATTHALVSSGTTHNTPNILGVEAGGNPAIVGSNFNSQYVFEQVPGSMSATSGHLGSAADHRGCVGLSNEAHFVGTAGTAGLLGHDANGDTTKVVLWGVNADASLGGTVQLDRPASVTDNDDLFSLPGGLPAFPDDDTIPGVGELGLNESQTAFRGGNGQVAIGKDQAGRTIVAATAYQDNGVGGGNNPDQGILVARIDGTTTEWTLASYNKFYIDGTGGLVEGGKPILDGPNGAAIGQVAHLYNVTGGAPLGPSMGPPMVDSVGNVWFLSAVELFDRIDSDGDGIPDASDFDSALLRAVYSPSTFSYQLELVMELGQVFTGANSGVDYQIGFLGIADSNSVSSGTAFSGNINQEACLGSDASQYNTSDAQTLGGLVVSVSLTYNSDADPTTIGSADDERYNALMYIGATTCAAGPNCDLVDFAPPMGVINTSDFIAFLNIFNTPADPRADFNCDGIVNTGDFIGFLNAYVPCS